MRYFRNLHYPVFKLFSKVFKNDTETQKLWNCHELVKVFTGNSIIESGSMKWDLRRMELRCFFLSWKFQIVCCSLWGLGLTNKMSFVITSLHKRQIRCKLFYFPAFFTGDKITAGNKKDIRRGELQPCSFRGKKSNKQEAETAACQRKKTCLYDEGKETE